MKYPVLLLHGMGFRDTGGKYWGRIPQTLKNAGYAVFFGGGDGCASIETNADTIAKNLEHALNETGAAKVNIIAHSKGGLEARYLASTMGLHTKIASITTISTPHHGSRTVDALLSCLPDHFIRFCCTVADAWFRALGDKQPDCYRAICTFKTKDAACFNENNPDKPGILYQSYAFVMKHCWSALSIWLPSLVVYYFEGKNDGLLAPAAVRWRNFRGIVRGNAGRGISHADEVDLHRKPMTRRQGNGVSDITDFYLAVARDLEEKGL